MMQVSVLVWSAIAIAVLMLVVWTISVRMKDASVVDIVWGLGFVVVAWVSRLAGGGAWNFRHTVTLIVTTVWGLRLAGYLGWRNIGKGEDYRYKLMRRKHGDRFWIVSLYTVFLTQGLLMWVVSLPVQFGEMRFSADEGRSQPLLLIGVGVVLWVVGLAFESIGDAQLAKFKADPASKGQVMDRGLWAWTRHPNYFGDFCVWWGIWLISAASPWRWGALIGIIGPIAMSILLTKVSGVPMLEYAMAKRRPGYAEYVKNTSSFFPRPPKKRSG
jgi:steroid 5-alpha reductase family enzyme